jgi:hypothetical protein
MVAVRSGHIRVVLLCLALCFQVLTFMRGVAVVHFSSPQAPDRATNTAVREDRPGSNAGGRPYRSAPASWQGALVDAAAAGGSRGAGTLGLQSGQPSHAGGQSSGQVDPLLPHSGTPGSLPSATPSPTDSGSAPQVGAGGGDQPPGEPDPDAEGENPLDPPDGGGDVGGGPEAEEFPIEPDPGR